MDYDAVIVGGSFAGLAVARQLQGQVLLIDRKEIGTGQTSACATLLRVLEEAGAQDSLLQVYSRGYIHTPQETFEYLFPYPLCTFDYSKFCQALAQGIEAKIIRARVLGVEGGQVISDAGPFQGKCLVDASGWRSVLGRCLRPGLVGRGGLNFGIETVVPYRGEGMHFWMDPQLIPGGWGWLFPGDGYARVGVGSYRGETRLGAFLEAFLHRLKLPRGPVHGGFFPYRPRPVTAGEVFLVGDAAGQCLPLTGEGIRPALYFARRCASLIQKIVDGQMEREAGLRQYQQLMEPFASYHRFLLWVQGKFARPSPLWLNPLLRLVHYRPVAHFLLRLYAHPPPARRASAPGD